MLHADAAVLVADGDAFEAGYVAATLQARGLRVLGPFGDLEEARMAFEAGVDAASNVYAAVIGQRSSAITTPLTDALQRHGVPYLLLLPHPAARPGRAEGEAPLLIKPFAAYQVADWVIGLADEHAAGEPTAEIIRVRAI